jgi:hypothetical protein
MVVIVFTHFLKMSTLDIYKAATWNAPAKDARYNLEEISMIY